MYKQGLEETEAELKKYNKAYSNNTKAYYEDLGIHSEQEYYEKVEELTEQQYDFAESINDTEQSIVDMYESNIDAVEEYIETLIDGYNDYIDSVKEALDAERDLYEFKKNVQKQSKDIAELERRIASLSGSTNKSEIAERRKLEAQLYEAREGLNDTYYDHAKDAQNDALDAEQSAYEETMNKFIQGMRESLETATQDMDTFLGNVTTMVSLNAGAILEQYQQTEFPLDDALTTPWKNAKEAVGNYSGDALELMNIWAQNGFLNTFPETVENSLKSPWEAGQTAVGAFKTSVDTQMAAIVQSIRTNVATAKAALSELYEGIEDTTENPPGETGGSGGGSGGGGSGDGGDGGGETALQKAIREAQAYVDAKGFSEGDKARWGQDTNFRPLLQAVYAAGGTIDNLKGKVYTQKGNTTTTTKTPTTTATKDQNDIGLDIGSTTYTKQEYEQKIKKDSKGNTYLPYTRKGSKDIWAKLNEGYTLTKDGSKYKIDWHSWKPLYKLTTKYAKGTTSTTRDEWAITDEPQFGDELVLVPGKDGNLSFMRKGTGVVPADMTQKLFELAQIPTSDLMKKNITAIVPDITKNDISNQFNFDSLVHVDHCDQGTLKDLEKMVDNKINDFSKQMNYSLKKFAR